MADVKQAATWMEDGRSVTRGGEYEDGYFPTFHWGPNGIEDENGDECVMTLGDILADDWKLVEQAST